MRIKLRIRPRTWMTRLRERHSPAGSLRRWWRPLSMVFRRRLAPRQGPDTPPGPARARATPTPVVPRLERHTHYHVHEGSRRIFNLPPPRVGFAASPCRATNARPGSEYWRPSRLPRGEAMHSLRADYAATLEHRISVTNLLRSHMITNRRFVTLMRTERGVSPHQSTGGTAVAHTERGFPLVHAPLGALTAGPRRTAAPSATRPPAVPAPATMRLDAALEHRLGRRARALRAGPEAYAIDLVVTQRPPASISWRNALPGAVALDSRPGKPRGDAGVVTGQGVANESARAPAPPAAPFQASPAVVRLEGPAIERLAEDVMQRIERRLRIERERRGM